MAARLGSSSDDDPMHNNINDHFGKYLPMKSSTSCFFGMLGMAPSWVMQRKAAELANLMASLKIFICSSVGNASSSSHLHHRVTLMRAHLSFHATFQESGAESRREAISSSDRVEDLIVLQDLFI
jgi:hypothetical protein